jgi:hypothetical protein
MASSSKIHDNHKNGSNVFDKVTNTLTYGHEAISLFSCDSLNL